MSQEIRLRWTSHQETIFTIFNNLLTTETLVDVTLAAEGRFLKAHQVILAASSSFFQIVLQTAEQHTKRVIMTDVLSQKSCNEKHPIIILKDVKYAELEALVSYMYRGEATILQDNLPSLLNVAQSLRIRGLFNNGSQEKTDNQKVLSSEQPPASVAQQNLVKEAEHPEEIPGEDISTGHLEQGSECLEMQELEETAEALMVKAELEEEVTDEDSISLSVSLTVNQPTAHPAENFNRNLAIRNNTSDLNNLTQHFNEVEGNSIWIEKETYECPKCGKKYTSNKSLWRHRKFACEGKQSFACSLCGKIFSRSDNLRRHAVVAHCAN